jgi:hypothetical protein
VCVKFSKGIIAGHGCVLAARKLGMTVIPTIELAYLTENQRQAYIIADNQLAISGAGWDPEMLRLEPPLPEHPVSQTGDLWLLGKHRLLCGDSTVAADVERVLGGVRPHLMVTDPPRVHFHS